VDVVFNPYDLYAHNGPEETPDVAKEAGSKKKNLPERWSTAAEQEEKKSQVADLQDSLEENLKPNGGMAVANMHDENKGRHETWIRVERLEKPLCGQNRPIFFRGVVTVVAKLFNIVEPDVAVFGKKDYQQWRVLCRMAQDLDFAVEIVGCPLLREDDGLAMSSRNVRLSDTERQQALSISRSLKEIEASVKMGEVDANLLVKCIIEKITAAGGKVDYAKIVEQDTLREVDKIKVPVVAAVAAHFGSVRLIDNIELQPPS
jgi:pantoate--beta-alanine ligase